MIINAYQLNALFCIPLFATLHVMILTLDAFDKNLIRIQCPFLLYAGYSGQS